MTKGQQRTGLSPRVRGNPPVPHAERLGVGSIPACAGEPPAVPHHTRLDRVYPRVCGGTRAAKTLEWHYNGLSPRVRGNLHHIRVGGQLIGSIPACAGEPTRAGQPQHQHRVYPRVCGGTVASRCTSTRRRGLSPRVRGNRARALHPGSGKRSIPACAGEPRFQPCPVQSAQVYPRVCGGTGMSTFPLLRRPGLSPRVRGNPSSAAGGMRRWRSIPACAGEPVGVAAVLRLPVVYPRVCGGTMAGICRPPSGRGLSPRVRGNPLRVQRRRLPFWSIPACAGEPIPKGHKPSCQWVYPRVCGGTSKIPALPVAPRGLSPRVRGNPACGQPESAR